MAHPMNIEFCVQWTLFSTCPPSWETVAPTIRYCLGPASLFIAEHACRGRLICSQPGEPFDHREKQVHACCLLYLSIRLDGSFCLYARAGYTSSCSGKILIDWREGLRVGDIRKTYAMGQQKTQIHSKHQRYGSLHVGAAFKGRSMRHATVAT